MPPLRYRYFCWRSPWRSIHNKILLVPSSFRNISGRVQVQGLPRRCFYLHEWGGRGLVEARFVLVHGSLQCVASQDWVEVSLLSFCPHTQKTERNSTHTITTQVRCQLRGRSGWASSHWVCPQVACRRRLGEANATADTLRWIFWVVKQLNLEVVSKIILLFNMESAEGMSELI